MGARAQEELKTGSRLGGLQLCWAGGQQGLSPWGVRLGISTEVKSLRGVSRAMGVQAPGSGGGTHSGREDSRCGFLAYKGSHQITGYGID